MKFEYQNRTIEYRIDYTKRKNLEVKLDAAGIVRVKAPKGVPEEKIEAVLKANAKQIFERQDQLWTKPERTAPKTFTEEAMFLYRGREYPLRIVVDDTVSKPVVSFKEDSFLITTHDGGEENLRRAMEKFYWKATNKIIKKRVALYQKEFKIKPRSISINDSMDKWGCCTSERHIDFHWRLSMAPLEVIDYLVVHEMCHLVHMNHSKSFWRLVGKLTPDYEKHEDWLKYNFLRMQF